MSVGEPGLQNLSFYYWDLNPQQVGYGAGFWADFPEVALSHEHLWFSYNVFSAAGVYADSVINKIPLATLASGGNLGYSFMNNTMGTIAPTSGANDTMYYMQHVDSDTLRMYSWADNSNSFFSWDINHSNFNATTYTCTSPDGNNACGWNDWRPLTGWVANGVVGFAWQAAQGSQALGNFPYPYVFVARINQSSKALIDEPTIWSADGAWNYPGVAVNGRGHLGWSLVYGAGANGYPSPVVSIWDDISSNQYIYTSGSTNTPDSDRWGDYTTTRAVSGWGNTWVFANFALLGPCAGGGTACANIQVVYTHFGRERDSVLCPDDGYEPDNAAASAVFISPTGTSSGHAFCSTDDQDWTYFYGYAGNHYRIETLNLGPGNDPVLTLYDSSLGFLATNDDNPSGGTLNSLINFVPTTTGYYYLKAGRLAGFRSHTFTYDVRVTRDEPPVTTPPAVTIANAQTMGNPSPGVYTVNIRESWTSSDSPEGVASQQLQYKTGANAFADVDPQVSATATSYTGPIGVGQQFRFRVRAFDTLGAYSAYKQGALVQMTGYSEARTEFTYAGAAWSTLTNANSWNGKVKTTAGGTNTKATFTFTGRRAALVIMKRPDGGKADIYVDGVKKQTLDFYSSVTSTRRVVYVTAGLSLAQHTVEVRWITGKNASSSGRNLYIDGMVTLN